ncbi:MAG: alpha/beta hydrolase-fold protein [bacterium]
MPTSWVLHRRGPCRVYIFLHGAGAIGAYHITAFRNTLDPLINDGTIAPMVVVFPEIRGDVPGYQPLFFEIHMYKNSARNGLFEDAVIVDLLSWLYTQSGYNVSSERGKRAIGGFSDGAVGSSFLAITHSDLFTALCFPSGELALRETEGLRAYPPGGGRRRAALRSGPADGLFHFFGRASAMSPNLVNHPAYFRSRLTRRGA